MRTKTERHHHNQRVVANCLKSLGCYWQSDDFTPTPGRYVKNKAFGCSCHRCRAYARIKKYKRHHQIWGM